MPRVDNNDAKVRDLSILLLPGQDIVHRQRGVISLLSYLGNQVEILVWRWSQSIVTTDLLADVNGDPRSYEPLQGYLVNEQPPVYEMCRSVAMCSCVFPLVEVVEGDPWRIANVVSNISLKLNWSAPFSLVHLMTTTSW